MSKAGILWYTFAFLTGIAFYAYGDSIPTQAEKNELVAQAKMYLNAYPGEVIDVRTAEPSIVVYCNVNYPPDNVPYLEGDAYVDLAKANPRIRKQQMEQLQCNTFIHGAGAADVPYSNNPGVNKGKLANIITYPMNMIDKECKASTIACTYCENKPRSEEHFCEILIYDPLYLVPAAPQQDKEIDMKFWTVVLDHEYKHVYIGPNHTPDVENFQDKGRTSAANQ